MLQWLSLMVRIRSLASGCGWCVFFFFFFNDTATTEIYTLSLHDALPILLWLKLVKDFLKVRCRLALLPFLISCNIPRSEERFSRNAETDLVCRLLLEKKKALNRVRDSRPDSHARPLALDDEAREADAATL